MSLYNFKKIMVVPPAKVSKIFNINDNKSQKKRNQIILLKLNWIIINLHMYFVFENFRILSI